MSDPQKVFRDMSLMMTPGATQLILIPFLASALAMLLAKDSRAALVAQYVAKNTLMVEGTSGSG